ncbi:TonB-dependent siderophore receptor [Pseudaquabacterium pictum]|uniref:TonB-dependent receptor n=1 Tax=Pseudaquabacterium pictum TaxID=2315236 RepID=A0A480AGZ2_9BURK|nr:TonB-dependent receptor [Rubrivivax pictus]GCL61029.1 TonB-dependent receptor [Rubrivivax pictus]
MAFRSVSVSSTHQLHRLACAALLACSAATQAQTADPAVQTVTVSGRSAGPASVAGFGDVPLSKSPFSATVLNANALQDAGITGIADLTRLDAGTTDAYNAPGYWGQLAVRGFTLDNRFNYRRDGLPINAETVIANGNKQAIEILKGTSGLQAGTSAPGGLVNLVVKRPKDNVGTATLAWTERNSLGVAVDLGRRADGFGWRLNADIEHLDPLTRHADGQRRMLALAVEAQPSRGSLLEAEVELSRQSQPSTPGFSLLGRRLPDASSVDPRLSLNNQAWSLPVVMSGRTASLRYTQDLDRDTQLVAHAMQQRLHSDDRIAFPFACGAENPDFIPPYTYCSDGSFDLYDFRSEGERRTSSAIDLAVSGQATLAGTRHRYSAGLMATRYQARFNRQAYNWVGNGQVDGSVQLPADPRLTDENTNRDERTTELHLQDAVTLSPQWSLWAGLRHTRLHRESVRTDGSRQTGYSQSFTTPWLALSHALTAEGQAYLSWGQGIESEVVPNRSRYNGPGEALPALKSRQVELGYKHSGPSLDWRVAAFDIRRPAWRDVGSCGSTAGSCTRQIDGAARHRGIEAEADWRIGPLNLRGSAMLLKARREGSTDASLNGLRPTNVPARSLKLQAAYNLGQVPGLALLAFITHEGDRQVLPDNSVATPGWTRLDVGARYTQRLAGRTVVWRAGIDNLANRRAWQEAPYQYDHAYLYPLAPRTLHASAQLSF